MLTPKQINDTIIGPALALLPAQMDTPEARVMMLAITFQEDPQQLRAQKVIIAGKAKKGPARGLWQFERGGGVTGVMTHAASRYWAATVCRVRKVEFTPAKVWAALETDDILAAAFARLLLFTDPKRLPALGDAEGAWKLYRVRTWRPGKPHPQNWPRNYETAMKTVRRL